MSESKLALFGGSKAVKSGNAKLFTWPIITREDEQAVLEVLRRRGMSGADVTREFEKEFAAWQGIKYALGCSSGTASLHCAMYGCKVGIGDEIICPSVTYWASCLQAFSLGATIVFAEIDPLTLCIDPRDIDRRIKEIQQAMNYFWDLLEGTPGMRAHRPAKDSGSTKGGWYAAHGLYVPEELEGLSATRFCEAVRSEEVLKKSGKEHCGFRGLNITSRA